MHTSRRVSWLSSFLVALVAIGCGPRSLPQRSSPALEPTGASPVLDGLVALDQRRDGVFSVYTEDEAIIQRMTDGTLTELFRYGGGADKLVSRADDDVLVASYDEIFRWDGVQLVDLTPRLEAALLLGLPFAGLRVTALDLAADGTVVAAVTLTGQGETAPFGQLCTLPPSGADVCEALEPISGDELASASAVIVEGARTYLVAEEQLYLREAGGAFSPLTADRVPFLMSIEGGRVGYVRETSSGSALHVLGPDGSEERRVESAWFVTGHSAAGLWEPTVDWEGDGSCGSFSWSTCHEATLWTQLTVVHLGEERREVAHLDNLPFAPLVLPLADGSLRLEIDGQVYEIDAP